MGLLVGGFARFLGFAFVGFLAALEGGGIAKIRGQQGCGLELFLHELRVDFALFFGTEFAPRDGLRAVAQFLRRHERDLRTERLVHFGAQDLHHVVRAVHFFLGHGFGERVLAQGFVELNPQSVRLLVEQHARNLGTVHVAADVVRQARHDRIPLFVGVAIVLRGGRGNRGTCNVRSELHIALRRSHRLLDGGKHGSRAGSHRVGDVRRSRGWLDGTHGLRRGRLGGNRLGGSALGCAASGARHGRPRDGLCGIARNHGNWHAGGRRIAGGGNGTGVLLTSGQQAGREKFQSHARRDGAVHIGERGIDRIGHGSERGQSQRGCLSAQIVHVFGRGIVGKHAFGALPSQREHQQVAHAGQQVLHESAGIESSDHDFLNHPVQRFAVFVGDGVDGLPDERVRGEAQQCDRGIVGDLAVHGTDHQLVEHGKRVPHGAAAGAHGQTQHARFRFDVLVVADLFQIRPHDLLRHEAERIVVGARADGADHLVRLGGGEDEHDMLRRLLHDFQQRVEALRRDHVGLVEDEDLVAVARGGESGAFAQFAGIVDAVVRGRVDFHDVDRSGASGGQIAAAFAFAARMRGGALLTVDAACENACGRGFAAASRSGEQIGVRELVLVKRAHQRNGDLVLPDHAFESVGTIPSVQCQCHRVFLPP